MLQVPTTSATSPIGKLVPVQSEFSPSTIRDFTKLLFRLFRKHGETLSDGFILSQACDKGISLDTNTVRQLLEHLHEEGKIMHDGNETHYL